MASAEPPKASAEARAVLQQYQPRRGAELRRNLVAVLSDLAARER